MHQLIRPFESMPAIVKRDFSETQNAFLLQGFGEEDVVRMLTRAFTENPDMHVKMSPKAAAVFRPQLPEHLRHQLGDTDEQETAKADELCAATFHPQPPSAQN